MKTKFTLALLATYLFLNYSYAYEKPPIGGYHKDSTSTENEKDTLLAGDSTHVDKDSVEFRPRLRILPMDTLVSIGSSIDYKAQMLNNSSEWVDINAEWSLKGEEVGTLSEKGHLEVTGLGIAYVVVHARDGKTVSRVVSRGSVADSLNLNTISISRVFPDGKILPSKVIKEGQSYKIGGLPAPLNLLNGAQIYFPVGSLHEDIAIQIKLPKFVKVDRDKNVNFGGKILNAISFDVYVNNVHIEPYYFDIPLNVILPFKRGVVRKMGLDVSKLSLFYAKDSTELDSMGISNVMLDTTTNQIYSQVAHFSSLALTQSSQFTALKDISNSNQLTVYPNPVVDNLTIDLNGLKTNGVSILVTNVLGQTVLTAKTTSTMIQLNTSALSTGVYQIQVLDTQNKLISVSKIVKK